MTEKNPPCPECGMRQAGPASGIGYWCENPHCWERDSARMLAGRTTERERALALEASLRRMLEVYWGAGDGGPDPDFIAEAKRLVARVREAA